LRSTPQGDDKLAVILSQEAKRLGALDRYERRALSRRNVAVQVFDRAAVGKCLEKQLVVTRWQNEAKNASDFNIGVDDASVVSNPSTPRS